jgi:hypothetical protein
LLKVSKSDCPGDMRKISTKRRECKVEFVAL